MTSEKAPSIRRINPPELGTPPGYSQIVDVSPGRVVFIGGGPPVWDVYARYIEHWDITRLPYDGEADRWFDPAWLVGGKRV